MYRVTLLHECILYVYINTCIKKVERVCATHACEGSEWNDIIYKYRGRYTLAYINATCIKKKKEKRHCWLDDEAFAPFAARVFLRLNVNKLYIRYTNVVAHKARKPDLRSLGGNKDRHHAVTLRERRRPRLSLPLSQHRESPHFREAKRSTVYVTHVARLGRRGASCRRADFVLLVPGVSRRLDAERAVELGRRATQELARASLWCLHVGR